MTPKSQKAEMIRGHKFFCDPKTPTVGVLRLDTDNEQHFLAVTKESLQKLSEVCLKHAEELQAVQ